MNSVHLIGRLATDVEVKEVNGGSKVSSFILAVDRSSDEADFAILHTKRWRGKTTAPGVATPAGSSR
jgi:single-stranded DNA-binding protein